MPLLTIIQGAATDLNLNKPTTVITSSDNQTLQMLSLAKREGQDLIRRFDWQALTKEASFTTVESEEQTTLATAAPDFFRFINESMNNRTQHWLVGGPLDAVKWQRMKSLGAQVGVRNWFRVRGNAILFYPTPNAGDSIYFEYISRYWVSDSNGTPKATFTADSDVANVDEDIVTLGVKWRFLKAKGLDYAEEFRTYEGALEAVFGADGARAPVDMTGEYTDEINPAVPDGSWNI